MTDITLVKTIVLRAPRERVWEYLTEPDLLARWFHEGQGKLEAGKPYALLRENPVSDDPRMLWGDVLVAEPPSRLVYTFEFEGQDPEISGTIEWQLEALSGGTKLTLTHTHSGPDNQALWDDLKATDSGWDEHLFRLRMCFH